MSAKKKASKPAKHDPAGKFVGEASDFQVIDDGKPVKPPKSFAELPYDVDKNGNPLPPPSEV